MAGAEQQQPGAREEWLATLDPGIAFYVDVLDAHGVETFESCQGGEGHAALEPMVRFFGQLGAGWHALSVALNHGLPVAELRRYWSVQDGEPVGPQWELTFGRVASEDASHPGWCGRLPRGRQTMMEPLA